LNCDLIVPQSHEGVEYLMLTPDRCLIFPSVDYVRNLVTKHSIRQGIPVVIDCSHIYGADYTAATVIEILTQDFAARDQPLFFYNLKPSVSSVFEGLSPKEFVVYYNHEDIDELLRNKSCIKKQILNV
jgi:sodium-independent sulfate anion transporter 11